MRNTVERAWNGCRTALFLVGLLWFSGFAVPAADSSRTADSATEAIIVSVNLKVWLEGPYLAGGSMTTDLNDDTTCGTATLPCSQPYDDALYAGTPIEYSGTESVADLSGSLATAVDWVLVELRMNTDAASMIARRAGLLMSDGTIKDTDGTSNLLFTGVPEDQYYAVVRHRNHLSVMSASTVTVSQSAPPLYDFTTAVTQAFGSGMTEVETGVFGLYAGDASGNQQVQNDDKNDLWQPDVGLAGYLPGDFSMNGQVQTTDKNDLWQVNVGLGSQVPE